VGLLFIRQVDIGILLSSDLWILVLDEKKKYLQMKVQSL